MNGLMNANWIVVDKGIGSNPDLYMSGYTTAMDAFSLSPYPDHAVVTTRRFALKLAAALKANRSPLTAKQIVIRYVGE